MATTPQKQSVNVGASLGNLQNQFKGLNPNQPWSWPSIPRYALCAVVAALVAAGLWYGLLDNSAELQAERDKEVKLREEYTNKLTQAINLDALRAQLAQVRQYVNQLEKQLPSKAEMDALLSDINQAGLGRSLQFELFKPGQVNVKEYYAEQPISVKVTGRYHDIGAFTADIANLSRIVTLNNMNITPSKDGSLLLDTTAKTFRYLDEEEIKAQRKASAPAGGKK
jgi:type IV pilus assembly protein PilO